MQTQEIIKIDIVKQFVESLTRLNLASLNECEAINAVIPYVKVLCSDVTWLPHDIPSCEKETIHLLHVGDDGNLMIFIDIWPGGSKNNNIHNHNTWSVIGSLVGHEINHIWKRVDNQSKPDYCELEYVERVDLLPGTVHSQLCSAIHSIENATPNKGIAVSLHVYGKDLRYTGREIYLPEKKIAYLNPNDEFNFIEDNSSY